MHWRRAVLCAVAWSLLSVQDDPAIVLQQYELIAESVTLNQIAT
jgi:hypothetical protein